MRLHLLGLAIQSLIGLLLGIALPLTSDFEGQDIDTLAVLAFVLAGMIGMSCYFAISAVAKTCEHGKSS